MQTIQKSNDQELSEKKYFLFKKVSLMDKFNFYEYLSIMLDGGITITEALKSSQSKIKNQYFKAQLEELYLFISSGDSFNKAMKKLPDVFSSKEHSIIEAGEKSGTLIASLNALSVESQKLHQLRQTIKTSLTYPIIIFIFLILAVTIVMTFVVPSLLPLIEESGGEIPFATLALKNTSDFIRNYYGIILLVILGGFLMGFAYISSDSGKKSFDEKILKIPLIGVVYKNYILSLSSSTLGILMNAGIPVIQSILLVGKSTNNIVYEDLFSFVATQVGQGKKIVDSMAEGDITGEYFPADFLQLLAVGEKTASLDKVCKKLSDQYTREVNYSLANLVKWIEPLAILISGIFVLWFAFAIFGAILKLTQTVG